MTSPIAQLLAFEFDWHLIDELRGVVVFQILNRMLDPGDGSVFEENNISVVTCAGDDLCSHQEDIYNPALMEKMLVAWQAHKESLATG